MCRAGGTVVAGVVRAVAAATPFLPYLSVVTTTSMSRLLVISSRARKAGAGAGAALPGVTVVRYR